MVKPGRTGRAAVAAKAMIGRTVWLGMERKEGTRTEVGRPARAVNASGSQSLHGTDGAMHRIDRRGEQTRAEGREAGRWRREVQSDASTRSASAGDG
jgi:hypothetical protein